jgi:hypothetical protein
MALTDYDFVLVLGKCGCEFDKRQRESLFKLIATAGREEKHAKRVINARGRG